MRSSLRPFAWLTLGITAGVLTVLACDLGPGRAVADAPECDGKPCKVVTADTDPARIESGVLEGRAFTGACPKIGSGELSHIAPGTLCAKVLDGPFFLTDLTSGCSLTNGDRETYVAIGGTPEAARWSVEKFWRSARFYVDGPGAIGSQHVQLSSADTLHGGRLLVREGESLFIGSTYNGPDANCRFNWSGFRPY